MLKKYKPSKWLSYLYFILPIGLITKMNVGKEADIWFLLSYGKKIVTSGFPKYDFLSMHEKFSFVMQQWLSAIIFAVIYKTGGNLGISIFITSLFTVIIYPFYKLCSCVSDNKYYLSLFLTLLFSLIMLPPFYNIKTTSYFLCNLSFIL